MKQSTNLKSNETIFNNSLLAKSFIFILTMQS